jgi:hypothetical protein
MKSAWKIGGGAALVAVAVIAGCSKGSDSITPTVSGVVVGSYFRNALVCADQNGNGRCDNGEPSGRTDNNGAFKINYVAGTDILAEIGTDATRYEPSDNSTSTVARAFVFRAHRSSLPAQTSGALVVLSAQTTAVAADVDAGTSLTTAQTKLAAQLGVDIGKVNADYNLEADSVAKGILTAYANNAIGVIQDVVASVVAGADLRSELNAALTVGSTQVGTVAYVWTQFGADDTPFSKLDITGISSGALNDNPNTVANGAATFTTALQSPNASLLASGGLFARAIVIPTAGAAACPAARINGVAATMTVRAPAATAVLSNGSFYGSAANVDFPVLTCELAIPATARSASVAGRPLKVVNSTSRINRILVMGDTGCRVKGPTAFNQTAAGVLGGGDPLQDCSSEAAWPFNKLSKVAASFSPDLILHNGDLHYREGFPTGTENRFGGAANAANGGTSVDNATILAKFQAAGIADSITFGWRAWEEDFFKATGPLLASAPWAITRGNHELCDRAGQGWYRFLDPRRFPKAGSAYAASDEPAYDSAYRRGSSFSVTKNCSQYTDPVSIVLSDLHLVLLDVGMMNDVPGLSSSLGASNGDHVRVARQLSALSQLPASTDTSKVTWIVSHKPFFAYAGAAANATNTPGSPVARTWQLQKAIIPGTESVASGNGTLPANTQMTHAGHIHGFQLLSQPASTNLPMSVMMGTSGDNLEGLIEANSGTPHASPSFGNNISTGNFPWLDQIINGTTVRGARWFVPSAANPLNFSSSPIVNPGRKETAVMTEFSFLVIDRIGTSTNWSIKVYDLNRRLLRTCTTSGKTASCDG